MVQGSYGYVLKINTGINLTGHTNAFMRIKTPTGIVAERSVSVLDRELGLVTFELKPDDSRVVGNLQIQLHVEFGNEKKLMSRVTTVEIEPSLE